MVWLKRVVKILLGILGAVVVLLLVFAGINLFDEDLNPAIKPLLEVPAMSLAPERNGYLYLVGFNAAADKNPHAVGMEIEKIIQAHYRHSGSWLTAPKINETVAGRAMSIPYGVLDKICDARKQPCLDRYLAETATIAKFRQENAFLLGRYQRLIAYPGYQDRPLFTYNDPIPAYHGVVTASRLAVIVAAQHVAAGRHREGAKAIAGDIRFWRRMLAGTNHLIGKMVATNRIGDDLKLLNELVARYPAFARDQAALLAEITQPLASAETAFCAVIHHESAMGARHLHALGQTTWRHRQELRELATQMGSTRVNLLAMMAPIGYAPNATLNLQVELNDATAPVCDAKPAALLQTAQAAKSRTAALMQKRASGLAMFYNPIGKAIFAIHPAFEDYRYRLIDLDGYLRATALHARIRAAGTRDEAIPGFIARAGAAYHDPYTDKPIAWNAKARTLTVTWNGKPRKTDGVAVIAVGR